MVERQHPKQARSVVDSELHRYVEYLQRGLLTPGSERAHGTGPFREWVASHRAQLIDLAQRSGGSAKTADELELQLAQYAPNSAFDSFTASVIFQLILDRVLVAAREANIGPERAVVFVNYRPVGFGRSAPFFRRTPPFRWSRSVRVL